MVGNFEIGTGQAKAVKAMVSFGPFRYRKNRTVRKTFHKISPSSKYQVFYEPLHEYKVCLPQIPHFPGSAVESHCAGTV